ncbi:MAG: sigma 54-interacting transcriptional regulator, partial [Candidatus Methylomirabilis sp.]|nr:sigma 54-interacting transcriptional regulator [Deltaproteobacteria bacterium]
MVTAFATVDSAVDAMKDGAFDYISKPFNTDDLVLSLQRALEARRIRAENAQLKRQLRGKYKFENMVGTSDAIQQVFQLVEKVADTDSTILLTGESGTGKELVARAIHYASRRAENAFVAVNCGAIPRELLESELFGHEKGAFTGAYAKRIGRFEYAGGGTILLDEVAEMPPELQVKLLRVLQE